jgi:cell division transport system permease protein
MGKLSFFFKEAFGSLRRNYFMTIAALVTVFLSIVVLGGVLIVVFTSEAMIEQMEQKVEIRVYFKSEPTDPPLDQMQALQAAILTWPEVKECVLVTKDEAMERIKEWYKETPEVYESLTSNPLPYSLEISLVNPQTVQTVAAQIEAQDPEKAILDDVRYGKDTAEKLFRVTSQVRNIMVGFIVLLGVVAILLISNTIRLSIFARKREVEIMKLVGATNWFIRWPFVIEGITVGLVGAAAAAATVLVVNSYLGDKLRTTLPLMLGVPSDAVPSTFIALVLLGVGVVIGAVGSALGLRRFLKV